MACDVFVVGALHWDIVVDADRLPLLDETLIGADVAYRFGGKGGNQAVAAARMGARVAMAGAVGRDESAAPILAALDSAGVARGQVRQIDGATGMSVAIVSASGEYGAVVVSGVNRALDAEKIDPSGARVVVLQNEVPEAVNRAVAAKAGTACVVLNAAPARAVSAELLARVDVLVVNRVEAQQMTATDTDAAALAALSELGVGAVVLTLGAKGALVRVGDETVALPAAFLADGSAHGAGDAFTGALVAELAKSETVLDAARFAMRAAACFVATPPDRRTDVTRAVVEAWPVGPT